MTPSTDHQAKVREVYRAIWREMHRPRKPSAPGSFTSQERQAMMDEIAPRESDKEESAQ